MTGRQFGTGAQQRCSGPWGDLDLSYPSPSSFTGRQNFTFGSSGETGNSSTRAGEGGGDLQVVKMTNGSREGALVPEDTHLSGDGYHGNGGPSSQPVSPEEPLDLSGVVGCHHQFQGAAGVTPEERRTPNPEASSNEAPPPNSSVDDQDPLDLSQQKKSPNFDDHLFSAAPKAAKVMKTELDDLQEKLERSREDYERRVFQNDRYTGQETSALLKAVIWKAKLHIKFDQLRIQDITVFMKSTLFWDSDFRGHGSLLDKFRENFGGGIRNRDGGSLKRKWDRIFNVIAQAPQQFFKRTIWMSEEQMDDQEKQFLVDLAKECCAMKGIKVSEERQGLTASLPMPTAPNSLGNPFLDNDIFQNGQARDDNMSVFSLSEWSSRFSIF